MYPEDHEIDRPYSSIIITEGDIRRTFETKLGSGVGWSKEGFMAEDYLNHLSKPLIEVGGPTEKGYKLIDFELLNRKLHASNIQHGVAEYDGNTGELLDFGPDVDFQADSTRLPIANESVSAVFGSNLYVNTRARTMTEATRVLERGGLLVWQGGNFKDFDNAKRSGFELVQYRIKDSRQGFLSFDMIFRKPELTDEVDEQPFAKVKSIVEEYDSDPSRVVGGWSREINFFITDHKDFPNRMEVSDIDDRGRKLSEREVVENTLRKYGTAGLEIPNYDTQTGERFTDKQKVMFLKTFQHVLSERYPNE